MKGIKLFGEIPKEFVRLKLRPHGWATVQLLAVNKESLHVESPALGKLLIPRAAIRAVEFE